jgi:hypothetical protein
LSAPRSSSRSDAAASAPGGDAASLVDRERVERWGSWACWAAVFNLWTLAGFALATREPGVALLCWLAGGVAAWGAARSGAEMKADLRRVVGALFRVKEVVP